MFGHVALASDWSRSWRGEGMVVYLLQRSSFYMNSRLVKGLSWRRPFSGIFGLDAQFQCRLFRLVQALIFGVRVDFLGHFFVLCVLCLVELAGSSHVILAGLGMLVGRSVGMVSRLGLVRLLLGIS